MSAKTISSRIGIGRWGVDVCGATSMSPRERTVISPKRKSLWEWIRGIVFCPMWRNMKLSFFVPTKERGDPMSTQKAGISYDVILVAKLMWEQSMIFRGDKCFIHSGFSILVCERLLVRIIRVCPFHLQRIMIRWNGRSSASWNYLEGQDCLRQSWSVAPEVSVLSRFDWQILLLLHHHAPNHG